MAISSQTDKALYNGDGATLTFAIPHTIVSSDSSEVEVYKRNTLVTPPTETLMVEGALQDYTLTGAAPPTTPFNTTVSFNAGKAPLSTDKVLVRRNMAITQPLDMTDSQATPLTSIETGLDRLLALLQLLDERLDRSPAYPISSNQTQPELPEPTAGSLIGYNSGGTNLAKFTIADIAAALNNSDLMSYHSFTLANNQSSVADVTSALIAQASYRSVTIEYTIERKTATQGIRATGELILEYERYSASYRITDLNKTEGHGINWSMSGGQLQYTSDNMAGGTYVGNMTWKFVRQIASET